MTTAKPYRGLGMEGPIATWYTKSTDRDMTRFTTIARIVTDRARPGSRVLEVAPGPGYLAIELAKRGYAVTVLDISQSFVRIARHNAAQAGVAVDVQHGNAAEMPFADASFDFVVCSAAFKNFRNPVGATDEVHRVLRTGGQATIFDLRKDVTREEIGAEVRRMNLSAWNALVTRWTFQFLLVKRAYTREQLVRLVADSRFAAGEVTSDGVGFELRLTKR
jgi:ubiquinone/menaquinone biosynthesis C-methylase UbiE